MTISETVLAGRYKIVNPIGEGGFGQTFLAQDNQLPDFPFCVIKQLKPKLDDPKDLETAKRLFVQEAKILHHLGNHDQIPRLFAHFEQDGEFYLVQEFIEGCSLDSEIVEDGKWSHDRVLTFLQDILQVLAFVHNAHAIHRDIKPANLMRRKSDLKIVLIDFGAVKSLSTDPASQTNETTSSSTVAIGSPGYMPIEQLAGNPQFSSDVYAVGMVCLKALTGTNCLDIPKDINTSELIWRNKATQISTGLADILDKMVRYDYRQRYQNASEVLQVIEQLVDRQQSERESTIPISIQKDISAQTIVTPLRQSLLEISEQTQPIQINHTQSLNGSKEQFKQQYRDRQILINKVKNYWIKGVLENSLHERAAIERGLIEKLDAVEHPWGLVLKRAEMPEQFLPFGTRIIDKFNELGMGRTLLVLGEPGSGKTTTLLRLAKDLIVQAELDPSMSAPVVFNLSSWQSKQSIADWLVQELNTKYQVSKELGRKWIKDEQLVLLLDGLDEVSSDRRQACVAAINHFKQANGRTEIVVCSRSIDYNDLSQRLHFQAAISLQELSINRVLQYLDRINVEIPMIGHALKLKELAFDDTLKELLKSPLILSVMILAYQNTLMKELNLPQTNSIEEYREHLFNAYIERMFERRSYKSIYPKHQVKRWLVWLAHRLVEQSQTVFLIEKIQPYWLNSVEMIFYQTLTGLIWALIGGLIGALIGGLIGGLMWGLIIGLIVGLVIGLRLGRVLQIELVESVKWSWKKFNRKFKRSLNVGIIGLFLGGVLGGMISGFLGGISGGLFFGFLGGTIFGLRDGLIALEVDAKVYPNQGIRKSALNALISGLGVLLITGLLSGLVFGLSVGLIGGIISGLSVGIILGLSVGLFFGGWACIQHFVLRLVLYFKGYIPWNYTQFLNWSTQLIFLQKVGGGYIFIHRLLLEHFAKMSIESV